MFYDGDIDAFFEEFAIDAIYTPHGGAAKTIDVIYDAPGSIITIGQTSIIIESPQATAKSSDVVGVTNNDTLLIGITSYFIRSYTCDSTGITILILSEA